MHDELAKLVVKITSILRENITYPQVPLGILLKNEMKHEDMISVLETLHCYVPSRTATESVDISGRSVSVKV